ncbi:MAG: phosphate transport system regulatory protein PhoU [Gammaproteobacteria bacterium]|nr:MAG: phosphate transport system regulatory protein PhoU [Gammaproteobacteria bacterium]
MSSGIGSHISRQFEDELEDIRNKVMAMGGLIEKQLQQAINCLLISDSALAEDVIKTDTAVNKMELDIDEECTQILARRQPTASDLRLVITVIKTINDLERIGDEAKRIARMALELMDKDVGKARLQAIKHLGEHVKTVLHHILDAFARMDTTEAYQIYRQDKQVDLEYESTLRQTITFMMEDPRSIPWALNIIWIARALERIGDRATNISEYIIFFVKGKDVRHTGVEGIEETIKDDL